MRYPLAWAETAKQNSVLKYSLLFSSFIAFTLLISTLVLSLKKPFIIERGCFSSLANLTQADRTNEEIESFLKTALDVRFSNDQQSPAYLWLSPTEEMAKVSELKELGAKKIKQKVLVNSVSIKNDMATVDIDRILSVDRLRTVLPASLLVRMSTTERSESNPYGLLIESIEVKKEMRPDEITK